MSVSITDGGKEAKAEVARKVNSVRKEILSQVQSGVVTYGNKRWAVCELDSRQLQDVTVNAFHAYLEQVN